MNLRLICFSDTALLSCGVDAELVPGWRIVAATAGIGDDAVERVAEVRFDSWNDGGERVAVIRVSRQRTKTSQQVLRGQISEQRHGASSRRQAISSETLDPTRIGDRPAAVKFRPRKAGPAGGRAFNYLALPRNFDPHVTVYGGSLYSGVACERRHSHGNAYRAALRIDGSVKKLEFFRIRGPIRHRHP